MEIVDLNNNIVDLNNNIVDLNKKIVDLNNISAQKWILMAPLFNRDASNEVSIFLISSKYYKHFHISKLL